MFNFKNRDDIPFFLNDENLLGFGIEIGVSQGVFSEHILEYWKGKKLFLVDTWRQFEEISYEDISNVNPDEQLNNMKKTFMKVYKFDARATIIRDYSSEAVNLFPDNFFDFVYLDAMHDHNNVYKDLSLWYPKIKTKGYFMGHDYLDCTYILEKKHRTKFEVKDAVDMFSFSNHVKVHVIPDPLYPSWYFKKE